MASHRHLSRIAVMQTLFTLKKREQKNPPEDLLSYTISEFASLIDDDTFAKSLLEGVIIYQEDIQKIIMEKASQFSLEKFDAVELSVLEIAIFELSFMEEKTPVPVVINEAVEIAKEFGTDSSGRFVNGVLAAVSSSQKK